MTNLLINGVNTGRDVSIILATNNGVSVPAAALGILTDFDVHGDDEVRTMRSVMTGKTHVTSTPKELTAVMKFKRYNSGLTDLGIAYRNASLTGTPMWFDLNFYVNNPDGSIDSYILSEGVPINPNFGNFGADQAVGQDLTFKFSGIDKTGGGSPNLFAGGALFQ